MITRIAKLPLITLSVCKDPYDSNNHLATATNRGLNYVDVASVSIYSKLRKLPNRVSTLLDGTFRNQKKKSVNERHLDHAALTREFNSTIRPPLDAVADTRHLKSEVRVSSVPGICAFLLRKAKQGIRNGTAQNGRKPEYEKGNG